MLDKAREWERSEEGSRFKNQMASSLLSAVQADVNPQVAVICKKYEIPERELTFTFDRIDISFFKHLEQMLENKRAMVLDKSIGEVVVDWLIWMPKIVHEVIKLGLRGTGWVYDKGFKLVSKFTGKDSFIEDLAPTGSGAGWVAMELSKSIREQLEKQYEEHIAAVRVWIV
jgi:hypothetical protein